MPRGKKKIISLSIESYTSNSIESYNYPRFIRFSNLHLVGNLKMAFPPLSCDDKNKIDQKQLTDFFNKYFSDWIITIESKGTIKEHIHFYIHNYKNLEEKTIRDYFREYFPQLKRPSKISDKTNKKSAGGANLVKTDKIHTKMQYAYIFKETKDLSYLVSSPGLNIDLPYVLKQKEIYRTHKIYSKAKGPGQFYLFILDEDVCINRDTLVSYYLEFLKMRNETFTQYNFIRCVNYVLLHSKPIILKNQLTNLLAQKYDNLL